MDQPIYFSILETIFEKEIYRFIYSGKKGCVEGPSVVFGPQQIKFRWPVYRGGSVIFKFVINKTYKKIMKNKIFFMIILKFVTNKAEHKIMNNKNILWSYDRTIFLLSI